MEYDEIFDMLMTELTEQALRELRAGSPEVQKAHARILTASERLHENDRLDGQSKMLVDEYLGALQLLSGEQNRHLYLQGAKDMVKLLRRFGVIK